MKLVIFGLTVSSSWDNDHCALWRSLIDALVARHHEVVFFERDQPNYARHRDLAALPGAKLVLYADWAQVASRARAELSEAEVGMVTSCCPDGIAASELVFESHCALRVFYDLDPATTLDAGAAGRVDYIGPRGLNDYDLVLSAASPDTFERLKSSLGARRVSELPPPSDDALAIGHGSSMQRAEQLECALDAAFRDLVVRGSDPGLSPAALAAAAAGMS